MNKIILFSVATTMLLFAGCSRDTDYRYYSAPAPTGQKFNSIHKVKDISGNPDVDILTIIDNSASMEAYQNYLSTNTDLFINTLTQGTSLHWKIALITTSSGEGPYLGMLPNDEVNYTDTTAANRFKNAISKLGTSGDAREQTYQPVLDKLKQYPNFLRSQADLVLLLVSDAPEQSDITTPDFVTELSKFKGGDTSRLFFYGTLDPSEWCPSTDDPFNWQGNKFDELLHLIKGAAYPICDKNFGKNMADIATRVVKNASTPRIYLEARPKTETLQVIFHGQILPSGPKDKGGYWFYNFHLNAVEFNDLSFAPGDLEEVQITYQEDVSTL